MPESKSIENAKFEYFIKRLGHQETGSRKERNDKAHRGRYVLIPTSSWDMFPHLSEYHLNDHAFVTLIPIYGSKTLGKGVFDYVFHNSKVCEAQSNGRYERRIYLSQMLDGGLGFCNDIVVLRRRIDVDTQEEADENSGFDKDSTLRVGFEYYIDWLRPDINQEEWTFYNNLIKQNQGNNSKRSFVRVETYFHEFEQKISNLKTTTISLDERVIASLTKQEPNVQQEIPLPFEDKDESSSKEWNFNDESLAVYAHLFNPSLFRDFVISTYGNTCAITGQVIAYGTFNNLEAAHINPKCNKGFFLPQNGIAMRKDIHWAFDKGMFYIDSQTLEVHVHEAVKDTYLGAYDGKKIQPIRKEFAPHPEYLEYHKQKIYTGFLHTGSIQKLVKSN